MVPRPIALGLTLCDGVIIEEKTRKMSLIGSFTSIKTSRFPSSLHPFSVVAVVTDGLGDATIKLSIIRLDTGLEIFSREMVCHFPDRLAEMRVHFKIQCAFPASGWYQVTLLADDEWLAQRRLKLYKEGDQP